MFNKAVIRGLAGDYGVDLGLVAETLLFYEQVHLAFDQASLTRFIQRVGLTATLELLTRNGVTASFTPQHAVVHSQETDTLTNYQFVEMSLVAQPDGRRISANDILLEAIAKGSDMSPNARRVEQLRRKIKMYNLPNGEGSISAASRAALADPNFSKQIPKIVLPELVPGIKIDEDCLFQVIQNEGSFSVVTDLPYDDINRLYHETVPSGHSTISTSYLLAHVTGARCDAHFAATNLGELVTSDAHSAVIRKLIFDLLSRRDSSVQQRDIFEHVSLQQGKAVRGVINSGERSFAEFISLLDKAERFRVWLHKHEDDAELAREYVAEINSTTWIESLPSRVVRFILFTGAGFLTNPAVGVGLGVFDTFVLQQILKGWKPNQFIEGPVKQFLKS